MFRRILAAISAAIAQAFSQVYRTVVRWTKNGIQLVQELVSLSPPPSAAQQLANQLADGGVTEGQIADATAVDRYDAENPVNKTIAAAAAVALGGRVEWPTGVGQLPHNLQYWLWQLSQEQAQHFSRLGRQKQFAILTGSLSLPTLPKIRAPGYYPVPGYWVSGGPYAQPPVEVVDAYARGAAALARKAAAIVAESKRAEAEFDVNDHVCELAPRPLKRID